MCIYIYSHKNCTSKDFVFETLNKHKIPFKAVVQNNDTVRIKPQVPECDDDIIDMILNGIL